MNSNQLPSATISLPTPATTGRMSLIEAIARRRSHREFTAMPLSLEEVSLLCWAAQGVTGDDSKRAAPSAGGLHGAKLLVANAEGVFEYRGKVHGLRRHVQGDVRDLLQSAALGQECVGKAPICLAIAIDVGRLTPNYRNRAQRYCLLEAGHVAQNVLLAATSLGLASVPVAAFDDAEISQVLQLPEYLQPVYLLPIGYQAA